jgi:hypothetical protein
VGDHGADLRSDADAHGIFPRADAGGIPDRRFIHEYIDAASSLLPADNHVCAEVRERNGNRNDHRVDAPVCNCNRCYRYTDITDMDGAGIAARTRCTDVLYAVREDYELRIVF